MKVLKATKKRLRTTALCSVDPISIRQRTDIKGEYFGAASWCGIAADEHTRRFAYHRGIAAPIPGAEEGARDIGSVARSLANSHSTHMNSCSQSFAASFLSLYVCIQGDHSARGIGAAIPR